MSDTPTTPLETAIATLRETTELSDERLAALFEAAFIDTYRHMVEADNGVRARVDLTAGSCTLYRRTGEGAEVPVDAGLPDFPRQAAQAARAAVATALREAGKDRVLREASMHRGELIDTIVDTRAGSVWYLRGGEMRILLPPEEQAEGEELIPGRHLKVIVLEGRRRSQDAVVVVSRSHPQLLRLLLEQEVPEVANGQVAVRGIVREAGRRSKVAVEATDPAVDARGACIGPRGIRHQAITSELGSEQVQIVVWSPDPAAYIANALAPATVRRVDLDESSRTATVTAASDQLSLAIGRGGDNARLVARLCGWRIDIVADIVEDE
ncbi:MAG: transcription termination/antitermination protein NusA [Candidatus Dormibacteraeota bacterium]|uniref:Transcription termination/antitermination protein NusA n=1 Tax=Candidatus Amunia macphersoniae TaxID=3127014 RepID=A0A934KIP3_9BACT|nr:transcription termination/antitermination protein NusA [Candidatus Dormibacteraeota bacterium]